ncbi:hypothetical protein RRG08_048302 [Elysia crispata]|uniref:Uncharacterized protein n=1 Tax=Elysia crispata TaxID=231223 RepID=A0AAE0ZUY5_9GAST|nr:hypothetical protein RRG08_048302 [Elysia crispata]
MRTPRVVSRCGRLTLMIIMLVWASISQEVKEQKNSLERSKQELRLEADNHNGDRTCTKHRSVFSGFSFFSVQHSQSDSANF